DPGGMLEDMANGGHKGVAVELVEGGDGQGHCALAVLADDGIIAYRRGGAPRTWLVLSGGGRSRWGRPRHPSPRRPRARRPAPGLFCQGAGAIFEDAFGIRHPDIPALGASPLDPKQEASTVFPEESVRLVQQRSACW